jgi:hypothetical protein
MSIHQFITEAQTQADSCDYGEMKDELSRDRIVVGVTDTKLREYLIDIDDLTLTKVIQKAKQYVSQHSSVLQIGSNPSANDNIDEVKDRMTRYKIRQQNEPQGVKRQKCPYCNRRQTHTKEQCPAKNVTCFGCKQKGHYSKSLACKRRQYRATDELEDSAVEAELGNLY